MQEILKVSQLTKTFNLSRKQQALEKTNAKKKVAVNDISFVAYKGEIFGLLGPNGAGKTTTLRILATLIDADSGDAQIDGLSVSADKDKLRGKIGFLTSDLKLEEFFTPNYLFDFFSDLHQIPVEQASQRKQFLFSRFGVDSFAEIKIAELSTGMKQKVSLAVSIAHDPDFIIFDEPTNGLDILTAKVVTDFLLDLKQQGKTIILSTHIFSLVEKLCDRVGIIIDGKLVKCDTLESITKQSNVEDAFFDLFNQTGGQNA